MKKFQQKTKEIISILLLLTLAVSFVYLGQFFNLQKPVKAQSTSLFPSARTARFLTQGSYTSASDNWRANHYDLAIRGDPTEMVAEKRINPNIKRLRYQVLLGPLQSSSFWTDWESYANTHGRDVELGYLHYETATEVDLEACNGGIITVPGWDTNPNSESRIPHCEWGSLRWLVNFSYGGIENFVADLYYNLTHTSYEGFYHDGIAIDEVWIYQSPAKRKSIEEYKQYGSVELQEDAYYNSLYSFLTYAKDAMGEDKIIVANTGGHSTMPSPSYLRSRTIGIGQAAGIWGEYWINPVRTGAPDYMWTIMDEVLDTGSYIMASTHQFTPPVANPFTDNGSNYNTGWERNAMSTLIYYYMAQPISGGDKYYYTFQHAHGGGPTGENDQFLENQWFEAVEYDIGTPIDRRTVGEEGVVNDWKYKIWARNFTNALILFRRIDWKESPSWVYNQDYDSNPVTYQLSGTYRMLMADGTLGEPITEVTLLNSDAVILIPEAVSHTKTVDKTEAAPGEVLTYTLDCTNNLSTEIINVKIEDPIPTGTSYINGSATNSGTFDGNKVIWNLGTLTPGNSDSVQFQVKIE